MKKPQNEPTLTYKKGSEERKALEEALKEMSEQTFEVPVVIGKERIYNNLDGKQLVVSLLTAVIFSIFIKEFWVYFCL